MTHPAIDTLMLLVLIGSVLAAVAHRNTTSWWSGFASCNAIYIGTQIVARIWGWS